MTQKNDTEELSSWGMPIDDSKKRPYQVRIEGRDGDEGHDFLELGCHTREDALALIKKELRTCWKNWNPQRAYINDELIEERK